MVLFLLVTCTLAIVAYYAVSYFRTQKASRQIQADAIDAMRQRILLDGEMLHAMKALMREGMLHQGTEGQRTTYRDK